MNGRINLSNLSDSLKDYLKELGLTEEEVYGLITLLIENDIGDINDLNTESNTIVEAINEIKDLVDNKNLSIYQTEVDDNLITESKTIVEAINEIYNSQDIVKQELVAALVSKGMNVNINMDFGTLIQYINNINNITAKGTATESNVLNGKTFINSTGKLLTGSMNNNGSKSITPSLSSQTLSSGYYDKVTINGDSNLIASNIKGGVSICGVTGTYYLCQTFKLSNVVIDNSDGGVYYNINHSLGEAPTKVRVTIKGIRGVSNKYTGTVWESDTVGDTLYSYGGNSVGTVISVPRVSIDNEDSTYDGDDYANANWNFSVATGYSTSTKACFFFGGGSGPKNCTITISSVTIYVSVGIY